MRFARPAILTRRTSWLIPVLLVSIACHKPAYADAARKAGLNPPQTIRPESVTGLQAYFDALDYDWSQLDSGVPPFILEGIPDDIDNSVSTAEKKRAFFMGLLPMVLLANQEIAREREEVLQILERYRVMEARPGDIPRLEEIMARYGLRGNPYSDHRLRARLLSRVDALPPSLVLAQAANESAWGTSKFARLGNNLFGEWTFRPGTGMIPDDRPAGETYEVRRFTSIYASIRSYMNNLNRNRAYARLREIREKLRKANQPVTGVALAQGLLKYSERGEDYIAEIQAMIRQNELSRVNTAFLRQTRIERLAVPGITGSGFFSTRNRLAGQLIPVRQHP